jgi:hypothetical protein
MCVAGNSTKCTIYSDHRTAATKYSFSVNAMKAYRWHRGIIPLIPNLGTKTEVSSQLHAPATLPRERTQVPIEQEAGWAPESLWTVVKKNLLPPLRFKPGTVQHVAKSLYRLLEAT